MTSVRIVIFGILFAITTQASPITASTGRKAFRTFNDILQSDVNSAEPLLRIFMEDKMKCSRVRLALRILQEDGVLRSGIFNLSLTADCDANISNLQIDFDPLCSRDNSGEAALLLHYTQSGHNISRRFIVSGSQSCQE